DHYAVGLMKRIDVARLEFLPARGDRARLEQRPEPLPGVAAPRAVERRGDGRRMMREIVDDRDAALDAANFHSPLDAFEGLQAFLDRRGFEAAQARRGDHCKRVEDVVLARERGAEAEPLLPFPP